MDVLHIIKEHIAKLEPSERASLKTASADLSLRYRTASYGDKPLSKHERYAYLLARLPATLAASLAVFRELQEHLPNFMPSSFADIGSGPATASWAAENLWPSLNRFQFVERDRNWIKLGKELAQTHPNLAQGQWIEHDLLYEIPLEPADLVTAAYAFQELPADRIDALCHELLAKASQALVIIEPGTPRGFNRLKELRASLIEKGAHILAPCTHQLACPMKENDWCHFSTRLHRGDAHRQLKEASLAFEDEKYAYLIATTNPLPSAEAARVIRAPIKRSGHIILDSCTNSGLSRQIIPRSEKERFREAKKLSWGSNILRTNQICNFDQTPGTKN